LAKRILYAIPALALLFTVIYLHGLYAKVAVALTAVICMHEVMRACAAVARPLRGVGFAYAALIYPAFEFAGGFMGIALLTVLGMIAVLIALVVTKRDAVDGLLTALSMMYPGLFFVFIIALLASPPPDVSRFLLIIAFGAAVVTDTFAYLTGILFGRHKLLPAVSPKKTVEGAAGGLLFGAGAVTVFGLVLTEPFGIRPIPLLWYALLGAVLSILSQFGDLAASYMKRRFGIKDFGRLMGEHGGAMDRLDSVLFICPAVFAFYLLFAA